LARAQAGQRLASLALESGVCPRTVYELKRKYANLSFEQLKKFRILEKENKLLKKFGKDQALQIKILNFVIKMTVAPSTDRARDLIQKIQTHFAISNRKATRYLGLNRSTFFYRNRGITN